jgi:hypothetical protein
MPHPHSGDSSGLLAIVESPIMNTRGAAELAAKSGAVMSARRRRVVRGSVSMVAIDSERSLGYDCNRAVAASVSEWIQ